MRVLLLALLLATAARAEPPPFIEAELSPADPFVQQQVTYTVRLFREPLQQGYLVAPEFPDVIAVPLGQDEPAEVLRDGRRLRMEERRYALFPQRSGRIAVPGLAYSGRDLHTRGADLALEVRPRPSDWDAARWLPARALRIGQTWTLPAGAVRAGGHIERLVTMTGEGVTGAQLPPLPLEAPPGFRQRRLTAETGEAVVGGMVMGHRHERLLLIPEQAGEFTLPGLAVAWWDVAAGLRREATAPGRRLTVWPPLAPQAVVPLAESSPAESSLAAAGAVRQAPATRAWRVLAGATAGLALALALWLAGRQRWRRLRRLAGARAALKAACRRGDAAAAHAALLRWAGFALAPAPASAGELARRLHDAEAARHLAALDAAVFGRRREWDGRAFARAVLPALRRAGSDDAQRPPPLLPPLK